MWGVGALPKAVFLLPKAAVSSSANGIPTTSEFERPPSFPTPRATDLKKKQQIKIEGQQQQQRILGSDIVMALQRAAAEKKKKKMKMAMKNKAQGLSVSSSSGDIPSGEEEDAVEISPIRINVDWTTRLDNLEAHLLLLSRSI